MIFRFGRKRNEDEEPEEEEFELVLFQGALNGAEIDLARHARLAEAGLIPAKELVTDALMRRAEAIRVEPRGQVAAVTLLIDGVAYSGGRLPRREALAITQIMKLLSGLDIRVRDKRQAGGLKAELQEKPYELRVESTPLKEGLERLTIFCRDLTQKLETPDDLGFSEELKGKIRELSSQRSGLLLACGPPRSGTTTTTFAILRGIDAYLYAIFSLRSDLEGRELANITPFQAEEGDSLEETLTRCIRAEADVIFVDPIRDAEFAQLLFKLAPKVTFVTEFTARDAAEGILQLIRWAGDPQQVATHVRGVFSQKLIRKLCEKCKQAYRPNPKLIEKMGLPPETKVLFRRFKPLDDEEEFEPCEQCGGTGYYGRMALIELVEMTDAMRKLVASGPTAEKIRALARSEGMSTFQKDSLRHLAEGRTSLEELQRVFKGG